MSLREELLTILEAETTHSEQEVNANIRKTLGNAVRRHGIKMKDEVAKRLKALEGTYGKVKVNSILKGWRGRGQVLYITDVVKVGDEQYEMGITIQQGVPMVYGAVALEARVSDDLRYVIDLVKEAGGKLQRKDMGLDQIGDAEELVRDGVLVLRGARPEDVRRGYYQFAEK